MGSNYSINCGYVCVAQAGFGLPSSLLQLSKHGGIKGMNREAQLVRGYFLCLSLFHFLDTRSHIAQASLTLTMQPRMVLNSLPLPPNALG